MDAIPGTVELVVEGPATRRFSLGRGSAAATVTSDAVGFVRWTTRTGGWEELGVQSTGDAAVLAAARSCRHLTAVVAYRTDR